MAIELPVAVGIIRTLRVNAERMSSALQDELLATDLADYLVCNGVPFRESHHVVGQVVKRAEELGVPLRKLELRQYQAVHSAFGQDVYSVFDFRRSVQVRDVEGSTSPSAVRAQIAGARALLAQTEEGAAGDN